MYYFVPTCTQGEGGKKVRFEKFGYKNATKHEKGDPH